MESYIEPLTWFTSGVGTRIGGREPSKRLWGFTLLLYYVNGTETVFMYCLHHFKYLLSVLWGRERRTGASLSDSLEAVSGQIRSGTDWKVICSPPAQPGPQDV